MKNKIGICIIVLLSVLIVLTVFNGIETKLIENEREDESQIMLSEKNTKETMENLDSNQYIIKIEENYLVIYSNYGKDLYFSTGIKIDDLPDDIKEKIYAGFGFETEMELYDFLENYSS